MSAKVTRAVTSCGTFGHISAENGHSETITVLCQLSYARYDPNGGDIEPGHWQVETAAVLILLQ